MSGVGRAGGTHKRLGPGGTRRLERAGGKAEKEGATAVERESKKEERARERGRAERKAGEQEEEARARADKTRGGGREEEGPVPGVASNEGEQPQRRAERQKRAQLTRRSLH